MLHIRANKRLEAFDLSVDLNLAQRITGLYGPSGSGKTTLLDCIAGLLKPDRGTISIDGHDLFRSEPGQERAIDTPVQSRRIGYVFQDCVLFEHMSVEKNLRYGRHDGDGPTFSQVVELLELGSLLDRSAGAISGGEKRRVALGRALLSGPRVLLLDEPLTGLDRRLAGKTLSYIRAVLDTFDLPALYVSHSVSDIVFLCDEVVVVDRGRVVAQDSPKALISTMETLDPLRPPALKNIFVADVIETNPSSDTLTCALGDHRLTVLGTVPSDTRRVTLIAPARDIILAKERPQGLSARNILPATVTRIEKLAAHRIVFVDVGTEWMVEVTRQAETELNLIPGAKVFAVVKASSIHCVDNAP